MSGRHALAAPLVRCVGLPEILDLVDATLVQIEAGLPLWALLHLHHQRQPLLPAW